jgi:hypothetical protein
MVVSTDIFQASLGKFLYDHCDALRELALDVVREAGRVGLERVPRAAERAAHAVLAEAVDERERVEAVPARQGELAVERSVRDERGVQKVELGALDWLMGSSVSGHSSSLVGMERVTVVETRLSSGFPASPLAVISNVNGEVLGLWAAAVHWRLGFLLGMVCLVWNVARFIFRLDSSRLSVGTV